MMALSSFIAKSKDTSFDFFAIENEPKNDALSVYSVTKQIGS
jgi:hypothetical protein